MKGFIWDPMVIGVMVFVLAIVFMIFIVMWGRLATNLQPMISNLNATEQNQILGLGNSYFFNSSQILLIFIYFVMILASIIAASYEGASTTYTLVLGIFFLIIALIVSMALSDAAHTFLMQNALVPYTKAHFQMGVYLLDNLPILTGIFIIMYMVIVITRKEILVKNNANGGSWVSG